jgi:hypothetical protein
MRYLAGVASVVVLLAGTSSAKAWFYYPRYGYYNYGACPDWYWSRGLLCPWSLCGGYGGWGGSGWNGCGYGGCCLPNYSFCPNPPMTVVTMESESEMGGYQAVSYVKVAGSRVGVIGGPAAR